MTGLAWACDKKQEKVAMLLMNRKAFIDARDMLGRTALFFAVRSQKPYLVRELLRRNASPWAPIGLDKFEILCDGHSSIMDLIGICRMADIHKQMAAPGKKKQAYDRITAGIFHERISNSILAEAMNKLLPGHRKEKANTGLDT